MSRTARPRVGSKDEPPRPPPRRPARAACIAGGVLLALSLGWVLQQWRTAPEPEMAEVDPASGQADPEPAPLPGLTNERFLADLAGELDLVNPLEDGWDSEAFSDAATARLKQLGKLLTAGKLAPGSLEPLVAPDFSCGRLRPGSIEEVYDSGNVVVRRSKDGGSKDGGQPAEQSPESGRGAARLIAALGSLIDSAAPATPAHASFKVVQVDAERPEASTVVYQELEFRGEAKIVQQNAVWRCRWRRADTGPRLLEIEVVDFEEVELASGSTLFSDCTESLFREEPSYREQLRYGLDHWRDRIDWRFGWEVVGPHGLAVGDVNGDGLDDLYVCETGGLPNRLLLQQPDGSVRDASARSGVDYVEPTQSALLADLDGDADQDLLTACGSYLLVFENDGDARFTRRCLTSTASMIRSVAAADYDLDGALDIYLCGYSSRHAAGDGVGLGRPLPYHDANNGSPNSLLRNQGDWKFEDVTAAVGLDVNNRRFSYAASWEDYDLDGDADLYVANDFGRNNLYRNDGGRFVDVAAAAGVEDVAAGMSVSWGDPNRDGRPDLYVGNMFSSAGRRIAYQRRFKEGAASAVREQYQRHARGNSLFENAGDGTFRDVSVLANVTTGRWAWSSLFVDLNNDGWEDIVVANGMITGAEDPGDL